MKWLKRLVVFALVVLGVVLLVLAVPVGRYAVLAVEDSSLAASDQARLQAAPEPVVQLLATDGGVPCLKGLVTRHGMPAAQVAVSAVPKRAGAGCGCTRGCGCAAAIDAAFADDSRLVTQLSGALGTASDETGQFTLCPTEPGAWLIFAEGAQSSTAQGGFTWPTLRRVELRLTDAITLTGRVVEQGKRQPIAGAEVLVVTSTGTPSLHLKTDASGVFATSVPNVALTVLARAPGYVPQQLDVKPTRAALAIELEPQVDFEVTVLDDERPVAGATVEADVGRQLVTTDEHGVARFTGLGRHEETFIARRGSKLAVDHHRPAPGLGRIRITMKLEQGFTISGTVTKHGEPLAKASITVADTPTGPQHFESDAAGQFETEPLLPGSYGVSIEHGPCSVYAKVPVRRRVDGVTADLGCDDESLRGRVVTRQGSPLPRGQVRATCGGTALETNTDLDGYFRLKAPSGLCSVQVSDERVATLIKRVNAPNHDVLLVVDEGAAICGHVVDEDNNPIRGAGVMVFNALVTQAIVEALRDVRARSVFTADDQGAFCIGGFSAGRYQLSAGYPREGVEHVESFAKQVTLGPGERVDVGVLVVKPVYELRGTVTDERGQPIIGATVSPGDDGRTATLVKAVALATMGDYSGAELLPQRGVSDAFGRFRVINAEHVTELHASAPGYLDKTVTLANQSEVSIQLTRNAEVFVRGRALSRGQPLPRVTVETYTFETGDGQFEVPVPLSPRGEGTVRLVAAEHHERTVSFTTAPSAAGPVDLGDVELEPLGTTPLTVRVTGERGEGIPGAHVALSSAGNTPSVQTDTDFFGRADVERAPDATTLTVTATGFEAKSQSVAAAVEKVDVVLTPVSRRHLEGVALGLDGQPAVGSTVRFGDARVLVGEDGHFALDDSTEGSTQLELETPEVTWGRTVAADQEHVEIGQLAGGGALEVTVVATGWLVLRHGEHPAMGRSEAGESPGRAGEFIHAPSVPPGTLRFTGLTPGRWSVYFFSFSERGLTALITTHYLSPQFVEVGVGTTTRLRLQ